MSGKQKLAILMPPVDSTYWNRRDYECNEGWNLLSEKQIRRPRSILHAFRYF